MPATLFNAPARPPLTRMVLLVLAMTLLAIASLAVAIRTGTGDADSAIAHTRFERRIATLPAITVTGPAGVKVVPSIQSARR